MFPASLAGAAFTINVNPVSVPTDETLKLNANDGRQGSAEATIRIRRETSVQPTAPQLVGAPRYRDITQNATVDAGDRILLRFDQAIDATNAQISDFDIEPGASSVGNGATIVATTRPDVAIQLGTSPTLKVRGSFDPTNISNLSPTALRVRPGQTGIIGAVGGLPAAGNDFVKLYPAFESLGAFGSSTGAHDFATADLNFDGFVDVVVATDDGVEIVDTNEALGGPAGISARLAAGTSFTSIALLDVDYDGQLEIAAAGDSKLSSQPTPHRSEQLPSPSLQRLPASSFPAGSSDAFADFRI